MKVSEVEAGAIRSFYGLQPRLLSLLFLTDPPRHSRRVTLAMLWRSPGPVIESLCPPVCTRKLRLQRQGNFQ